MRTRIAVVIAALLLAAVPLSAASAQMKSRKSPRNWWTLPKQVCVTFSIQPPITICIDPDKLETDLPIQWMKVSPK
jgi:hypothetical protein